MIGRKAEMVIASIFFLLGLVAALVWVPLDSETWMIETFRRQTTMGDAFLPMIAASLITLCSAAHLLMSFLRKDDMDNESSVIGLDVLAFLVQLLGIVAVSLAIMYWAGPLAVQLFAQGDGSEVLTYRQMRGTYPFKLTGFALGGFTLVYLVTSLIEGRFKWSRIISSILAVAVLIAVFDLPLDNVLLPPNGDW